MAGKRDIVISLITRSDKKGLSDAEKGLENLGKKAEKSGGLFKGLSDKLSGFGDNVGKNVTGKLGAAGDAAENLGLGLDGMSGATAAAGAGLAAFAGFVADGVGKVKELYDQTRNFNEVAGTSWEEGSRLIAVFDDLRVSSEEGASAMGKLTKTVGTSPEVLKQYGIEIVKAKDGTVDMAGTLENVATKFQQTTDPAKRAALGSALFGKSWQNMVPVLDKGGDSLKELIDGVDKHQVATAKGAAEQDKLYEATDNLHDAIDGLQRALAQDAIPKLIELAEWSAKGVSAMSAINDKVPILDALTSSVPGPGMLSKAKDAFGELGSVIGIGGDKSKDAATWMGILTGKFKEAVGPIEDTNLAMETQRRRAADAADAYKDFKKKVDDLLKQQEDMRNAQLETEDSSLAYEKAQIAAGDASGELSEKAKIAADAIATHGADSEEAKLAVEDHRRSLLDARIAMDQSADAAVANAEKIAAGNGVTLTAAEKIAIYRDEMVRLRDGAKDPDLIAALDGVIAKYAELAKQAQSAEANLRGLRQEQARQSGIEANYTSRDSSGAAVTRRATGGPVWPGQQYLVGEHGPEMITWNGNGPGYVLSSPETQRMSGLAASNPSVRYNPDGTVQFGGDPATYSGATVRKDYTPAPAPVYVPPPLIRPLGLGDSYSGTTTLSSAGGSGGGGGGTYNITLNGVIIGDEQKLGAFLVEILRKYDRARA